MRIEEEPRVFKMTVEQAKSIFGTLRHEYRIPILPVICSYESYSAPPLTTEHMKYHIVKVYEDLSLSEQADNADLIFKLGIATKADGDDKSLTTEARLKRGMDVVGRLIREIQWDALLKDVQPREDSDEATTGKD